MLKIEVIKFEAQDVITTSVAEPVTCYCDDGCGEYEGSYIGKLKHSPHEPCTKCKFNLYQLK